MPQPLGDDLHRHAFLEQQRRDGVPGAVDLDPAHPGIREDLNEGAPHERPARLAEGRRGRLQVPRFLREDEPGVLISRNA